MLRCNGISGRCPGFSVQVVGLYVEFGQNGWCAGQLRGLDVEAAVDPAEWAEKRTRKGKLDAIEARQLDDWVKSSGIGRVRGFVRLWKIIAQCKGGL